MSDRDVGSTFSAEEVATIDRLGAAGWELVTVDNGICCFKRERRGDQGPQDPTAPPIQPAAAD